MEEDVETTSRSRVAASAALEAVTRRLLELLGRVSGLETTYLTFIDWSGDSQEILFARNAGDMQIPEGLRVDWEDTLCRRALSGGPACTSDVPGLYPDSAAARELGITTYVTAPVQGPEGVVFGTLCGASTEAVEVGPEARMLLETLAEMIALQLAHDVAAQAVADQAQRLADANSDLEKMALTDPLTGLSNRRALDEDLTRACSEARRREEPVALLTLDVDKFKTVNDTLGHGAGDAVLVTVAARLQEQARGHDLVARMGGDEFIVILRNTDGPTAQQVAERVRLAVASFPVTTSAGEVWISVSIGVASQRNPDPDGLRRGADDALYAAKGAGRNAVMTASA